MPRSITKPLSQRRLEYWLDQLSGAPPALKRAIPKPLSRKAARGAGYLLSAELKLVGAAAIKKINFKYRGINESTDILSFPAPKLFQLHGYLGELVIGLPALKRQAKEYGHTERDELDVLLVHGLLHLIGFDHEGSEKKLKEMRKWEKYLLKNAGLIERARLG